MNKKQTPISAKTTIYDLIRMNPGIEDILSDIGFTEIKKPIMLSTVGKFITIEKGCKIRNLDIKTVKSILLDHGYDLYNIKE